MAAVGRPTPNRQSVAVRAGILWDAFGSRSLVCGSSSQVDGVKSLGPLILWRLSNLKAERHDPLPRLRSETGAVSDHCRWRRSDLLSAVRPVPSRWL